MMKNPKFSITKMTKCALCPSIATGQCSKCCAYLCNYCFKNHYDVQKCSFFGCYRPSSTYGGSRCAYHGNRMMFK